MFSWVAIHFIHLFKYLLILKIYFIRVFVTIELLNYYFICIFIVIIITTRENNSFLVYH